ncbi:MAG: haloacid dehalogenase-like hydrolase [Alphaproteobacteria bacterium]|nr:haloacid dehalogenase-like hydrolase [Alphaproteobacteria bacterium]
MKRNNIIVALLYDFDGTLAPGNMHEHGFIEKMGLTTNEFWNKSDNLALEQNADSNLAYMWLTLEEAKRLGTKKEDFMSYGSKITYFKGVEDWFKRINDYGKELGITVEHYLISSGLSEIVEGMSIYPNFKKVYANRYMYDKNGVAHWPARIVNYTDKTQYLYRISKGCLDEGDKSVNDRCENIRIPFTNMLYFGDGLTDVPCMAILQDYGGHSVGVYTPCKKGNQKNVKKLLEDGRINISAPADYSEGSKIDTYVKTLLRKIKADSELTSL